MLFRSKITRGYKLPAKFVIHTVGPIWNGGQHREAELLASCYRNSLALAREHGIKTIAFPAISCGVYRYPLEQAVAIAVRETAAYIAAENSIEKIIFACFGAESLDAYQRELARL